MGKYVNQIKGIQLGSSFNSKCEKLSKMGAIHVDDSAFIENMVCVVDNGFFAAAAYAYSESEYNQFKQIDGRPKKWFTLENVSEYVD
jgi:hypothetical protein